MYVCMLYVCMCFTLCLVQKYETLPISLSLQNTLTKMPRKKKVSYDNMHNLRTPTAKKVHSFLAFPSTFLVKLGAGRVSYVCTIVEIPVTSCCNPYSIIAYSYSYTVL
jgi:hypothetical protein